MTSQQLIEARAALWHHNAEPILTLEDAASWVATTGLLLFLPRQQQLRAPSPTFVEASMGKLEHTPARPEIENALALAKRLFATGNVLPLNLLGTLNEEPDFLIARDRLPWLMALRSDRSWKSAPGGRTSPLNISIWKLLNEQGGLTVGEICSGVGREVSGSSVLRALVDLWGSLRVFPSYSERDGDTVWVLSKTLCPKECAKGASTSQGAALSLFLADYLRSVIAATEDEISSFLSPLASRSRLREVLHALVATRQLATVALGPNTLYYVAGEMPEFPAVEPATSSEETPQSQPEDKPYTTTEDHQRIHTYSPRPESRESSSRHTPSERSDRPQRDLRRPGSDRPAGRKPGFTPRGDFKSRPSGGKFNRPSRDSNREGREYRDSRPPRREGGFRPPFRKPRPESEFGPAESGRPEHGSRSSTDDRRPFRKSGFEDRGRKPLARKFQDSGQRKPYGQKFERDGDRKPYGDRKPFGDRKPYSDRERPDFRSRSERSGSRPDFRKDRRDDDRPHRESESSGRPPRKNFGKPGGFSKPSGKSFGKSSDRSGKNSFGKRPGKPAGRDAKKPFGKGPGKPAGKSGFTKGPGKSFGKKFSKGPGKGQSKGSFHGSGKPHRRPKDQ